MNATDRTTRSELIQPGQSFGKFYLVQSIGEGGTSRIFKALQQPISRLVAIKIPSFSVESNVLTPDEFLTEATLMARLEHPNIVRIYDFGVSDGQAFICMEYVEGWNLLELGQNQGPLPLPAVLALGRQTLDALLYSHSQGVLHLDLSPANLLVAKSGMVKLLDFGMAGKKQPVGQGKVIGTPAFLSPEHVLGQTGKQQSDLFSFGSLLYFAATGEQLFDPGPGNIHLSEMLKAIAGSREHPPEEKLRRLPQVLAPIITLALTGSDPRELSKNLQENWAKLSGENTPAEVLGRELNPGRETERPTGFLTSTRSRPLVEEPLPSDQELREQFSTLRAEGRHREAMSLLEKALRRQPDNPMLAELLASPPGKAKSTPATMAVTAATPLDAPAKTSKPGKEPRLLPLVLGFLLVTLAAYLIWDKTRVRPVEATPSEDLNLKSVPKKESVSQPLPPFIAEPKPTQVRDHAKRPATQANRNRAALAISGPRGIRISLNDSLKWISPSPKGGWDLEPGLINLSLDLPGGLHPINSSLYLSADSLYILKVELDGGFSVSRQRRR